MLSFLAIVLLPKPSSYNCCIFEIISSEGLTQVLPFIPFVTHNKIKKYRK